MAVSTDSTGSEQVVLAVFQQVLNWSSNRFSTSCDWLAVEFSRKDGNLATNNEESRGAIVKEFALAIVYARTAAASVSARGEVMVELRRNGT